MDLERLKLSKSTNRKGTKVLLYTILLTDLQNIYMDAGKVQSAFQLRNLDMFVYLSSLIR